MIYPNTQKHILKFTIIPALLPSKKLYYIKLYYLILLSNSKIYISKRYDIPRSIEKLFK